MGAQELFDSFLIKSVKPLPQQLTQNLPFPQVPHSDIFPLILKT